MTNVQQKSWFGRNWKWLVPVGCLVPLVCIVAVCGGTVLFGLHMIKQSPPYRTALAAARENPEVVEALGEPIEPGFMAIGEFNVSADDTGRADITIPISGPRGKGAIHVSGVAGPGADGWEYTRMTVVIEGTGEEIDLRGEMVDEPHFPPDEEELPFDAEAAPPVTVPDETVLEDGEPMPET